MVTLRTTSEHHQPDPPEDLDALVLQFGADGYGANGRNTARRRIPQDLELRFTNALRQAAHLWHNVLDDTLRNLWTYYAGTQDGARPERRESPANGWCLFAQYALAPCWYDAPNPAGPIPTDAAYAQDVTFDLADADTQLLHFTATFPEDLTPNEATVFFAYQVDPQYIGTARAFRRTMLAGYYHTPYPTDPPFAWSCPAPYPFQLNEAVHCLVRQHVAPFGVQNFQLYIDAT